MRVTVTWGVARGSVWEKLALRLGRQPTNAEAKAEVQRILDEGLIDLAEKGKLKHQKRK
jgi:hypothetical protein